VIALHTAAQAATEQMALSLAAGSALALCASIALRLAPQHNSRARFTLWFGVLISIAVVPLLALTSHHVQAAAGATHAWITIPESSALYIFGLWAVVACAGLARVITGLMLVGRVRTSCEEISPDELPACVRESLARFATRRAVKVCVSSEVRVPTAIGFFRPMVVIPRWLFGELPAGELNQLVLHELAHLARWDDWTNLTQKIVRAALFFHPAVWWIDQRLSLEREMACDDAVVAATGNRRSYAECLAMLAEKTLGRRSAELAQAAVHRVQQVTARVLRILDPPSASSRGRWAWFVTASSTVAVAGLIAVSGGTSWIAFRAPETGSAQAATPVRLHSNVAGESVVVPAAMPLTKTVHPLAAVQRHVSVAAARQPNRTRMIAATTPRQQVASHSSAQSMTNPVIPAKAVTDGQGNASDVMVFTVFSNAQGNVQVWRLTVYVPAQAPSPAPRKTT
jgi:beta-lactamase regulating signal transducer with metallopeptidase domain